MSVVFMTAEHPSSTHFQFWVRTHRPREARHVAVTPDQLACGVVAESDSSNG
jgi:hypothetical protein